MRRYARSKPVKKVGLAAVLLTALVLILQMYTDRTRHEGSGEKFGKGDTFAGEVVSVSDGDTLDVLHNGKAQRVRLYGVDAPEKSQDYGMAAKQFTSSKCFGKQVTVHVMDRDRYDRLVGEVILPTGETLNRLLVEAGYAWWYRQYSHDNSLGVLEEQARKARRGLWAGKKPVAPWEYRQHEREERQERGSDESGKP